MRESHPITRKAPPKINFYAGVIYHNGNYYLSEQLRSPYIFYFLEWLLTKPAKEYHCIYLDKNHESLKKNDLASLIDWAGMRRLYIGDFGAKLAILERDQFFIHSYVSVHESIKNNYKILIYFSECGEILAEPELNGFASSKINRLLQRDFISEIKFSQAFVPPPILAKCCMIPYNIHHFKLMSFLKRHLDLPVILDPKFKLKNAINLVHSLKDRQIVIRNLYGWNLDSYQILFENISRSNRLKDKPKVILGYPCSPEIANIFKDLTTIPIKIEIKQPPISAFFKSESQNQLKINKKSLSKEPNIDVPFLALPKTAWREFENQQILSRGIRFNHSIEKSKTTEGTASEVEPSAIFSLLNSKSSSN